MWSLSVTTGRKPRTGLKPEVQQEWLKSHDGHDGEKTQDGIETLRPQVMGQQTGMGSRRGENPGRD